MCLCAYAAKDADEKEKWIFALQNAISRQDNHVRFLYNYCLDVRYLFKQ